ncbi:hypothetical protein NSK_000566 [Nannochloropsis salina CCMP1776]|uniref:Phosphoribulokinase/uridine kinase domain-containing protein n=1 Tax=Nannochloropsis salina CCMP1776 TaxID=1027361 RepID=A0A4D9DF09_9STRA|nr:hypothetical protein NSK_000566 [Nannochloropsis salina CCMP1776]|eukprot:TFJ88215.1 hypothetical protein NSK_000566 [Nannochloropsis salina CCMP1776]
MRVSRDISHLVGSPSGTFACVVNPLFGDYQSPKLTHFTYKFVIPPYLFAASSSIFGCATFLDGLSCVALSIDDFYLTNDDQQRLAAQHSGNRLLEHRGNAGTHDVALGRDTIIQCVQAGEGGKVALPRYDKSLGAGRGDRAHRQQWPVVEGRIDVVLLEGWMLGFRPLPPDAPQLQKEAGLAQVNANLGEYEQWHALVDAWAVIQVEDLSVIASWRLEAERRMRRERGAEGGMTDAQVRDFVSRFMPSYTAFSEHSIYNEDELSRKKPVLRILFDKERNPTG